MTSPSRTNDPHRWLVFAIISSAYFFVYFHRVSTSVIARDLLIAFQTHATALGIMSSMYFYVYAVEQPFVGYLTDRLGPRRVVGFWTIIAACGCVVFGLAPTIFWAAVGRGLIGLGVGGVYVPALKSFSIWFRKRDFATLTGLFLAVGNLGAIVATTPLVWITKSCGWRQGFLIIGGISLVIAAATLLLLRDHPRMLSREDETVHDQAGDSGESRKTIILRVVTSFYFWSFAAILFSSMGAFLTLQGLWAAPFLMSVYGLELSRASNLNMLIPIGFVVFSPLWGWLGNSVFRRKTDLLITLLAVMTLVWLAITMPAHVLGIAGVSAVMFVSGGLACGIATTVWTLVRETTPQHILGAASGLLNPFPLFGVAVFQSITGAVLDWVGIRDGMYPPVAFRYAFVICLLATGTCLILSFFVARHLSRTEQGRV